MVSWSFYADKSWVTGETFDFAHPLSLSWFAMCFDVFWCVLMCFDVFWCLLMCFNVFWCLLLRFVTFRCLSMAFDVFRCLLISVDIRMSCIRKLYKLFTLDSMELEREEIAHNLAHRRLHICCQTKALSRASCHSITKKYFWFYTFLFQADMKRINRQIKVWFSYFEIDSLQLF